MEVGELSTEDDVVTKEASSTCSQGKAPREGEEVVASAETGERETEQNTPRVVYSKEELLSLRESPASKLWPSILSEEHVWHGVWDPEMWHQSSSSGKRCASPGEELKKQLLIEDGIVLSPQRQSFVQGCQIPQSTPERNNQQERVKTGLSRTSDREREGRGRLTGRVGRGRALDYKERTPLQERNKDPEELSGKYSGFREREDRADRGYGKEKDKGFRERDQDQNRNREEHSRGRNIQVRKKHVKESKNEEPEWFTFGPSSQFETMELKGFDDDEFEKKDQERRKSASDELKAILSVGKKALVNGEVKSSSATTGSGPSQEWADEMKTKKTKDAKENVNGTADDSHKQDAKPFDINDFFVSESLLPFSGGVDQASSRFCQFFGQPGSNYSSSRSGSPGIASGGANTPRTPSPGPNYLFSPIAPSVVDGVDSRGLAHMLHSSRMNMQPLLDEVMSFGKESKVRGSVRLEDIEAEVTKNAADFAKKETSDLEQNKENLKSGGTTSSKEEMLAFDMLVEKMKSSGTLPEKPQPVIPGLPSRLLPRPPSPKRKTSRNTPSPYHDLRRSPSPAELLQRMTMQGPLSDHRSPSPAQVVPQMNRSPSPLEMFHKYGAIVSPSQDVFASPLLRHTPSPRAMLAQQRESPPLGFGGVNLYNLPPHVMSLYLGGHHPGMQLKGNQKPPSRKPQGGNTTPGGAPEPRNQTLSHSKPTSEGQTGSPFIPDRSFMPTSVLRKIRQEQFDQKMPKCDEQPKVRTSVAVEEAIANNRDHTADQHPSQAKARSQSGNADDLIKTTLLQQYVTENDAHVNKTAPKLDHLLSPRSMMSNDSQIPQSGSPILQKPTAFRPLPGSPQIPFPTFKSSGIHSEPASPLRSFNQSGGSPLRPVKPLSHSEPGTPQRHPLADKTPLLSPQQLVSKSLMPRVHGKPGEGLLGHATTLESQGKGIRSGITRVVTANEGRPLTHSFEQQPHSIPEKVAVPEDVFQAKRNESLAKSHHGLPMQKINSTEMSTPYENLPPNHPQGIHGSGTRPSAAHFMTRSFPGLHGPRPGPHVRNGRMSPSSVPAMHGHPGRTPFNSPMPGMAMPPRSAMHPGMIPPHMQAAYLRMMSSSGNPMGGIPSPGLNPMSMRLPIPHSAGRYPLMPGHNPAAAAMMYGGRPSPAYPPVNPATMIGARSHHIPHQVGLQQVQARPVSSPVMNHPSQPHSPGGSGSGNILSKWFSEDVLQQAAPVHKDTAADFSRKFMSVEELERQQTAAMN